MSDAVDWRTATWEGSRRAQLAQAAEMTVRERLEAMESLYRTGVTLLGASGRGSSTSSLEAVELEGCGPTPLASYLKALGVLRLLAEQVDPDARGCWQAEHFHLYTRLSAAEVEAFFTDLYRPTPLVAPWGGRSGFYPGSSENAARKALDAIVDSDEPRVSAFARAIQDVRELLGRLGHAEKPKGKDEKLDLLRSCRAELRDELLPWLDACFVLTQEGQRFPPLLGTGGNEGSGSYVSGFAQQVVACIVRRDFDHALASALFARAVPNVGTDQTPGQFSPVDTGGPNSDSASAGYLVMNPWDYLLCLEGTLLFAASATRRLEGSGAGGVSLPFTVKTTGSGTGAIALGDEEGARAEMWLPLWSAPASLQELEALFSEGRAHVPRGRARPRAAQDGLEFTRAVASLGVSRGVDQFQRYAMTQRFGRNVIAVPLNRIDVQRNPAADLLDDLDRRDWLRRLRRLGRKGPARLQSLVRRLEDALFDLTLVRPSEGELRPAEVAQALLVVIGEVHLYLATSPSVRDRCPPVPRLPRTWQAASDDGSAEFSIAVALAGLHARVSHRGSRRSMPLAVHFAPVSDDARRWDESQHNRVVWRGKDLHRNVGAVLNRRLLLATDVSGTTIQEPFAPRAFSGLRDVSALLAEDLDEMKVTRLLCGLAWIDVGPNRSSRRDSAEGGWPVPAAYLLLKPLFMSSTDLARTGLIENTENISASGSPPRDVVQRLRSGDAPGAMKAAVRRLRGLGLTPRMPLEPVDIKGPRLLTALAIPVAPGELERAIRPIFEPPELDPIQQKGRLT